MDLKQIILFINFFFLVYMFLYAVYVFLNTMVASFQLDDFSIKKSHMVYPQLNNRENYIPISIIVPAYNEEVTIISSITSLLHLRYPKVEIIIVNDGSKDSTMQKVRDHFELKEVKRPIHKQINCKEIKSIYEGDFEGKQIVLVDKQNGGKSDALNTGINVSRYPLFICMDADSILEYDSLEKIVVPFLESDDVVAVGGNINVANQATIQNGKIVKIDTPKKWLVMFQMIEYFRVFLMSRVAMNGLNANLIISGAFGLYNKKAVIKVGGYTTDIIGEDMDLIVKLHCYYRKNKLPYKIEYVPDAFCWTQVPEKVSVLKSQRKRWHIGMGQALFSHSFMFFRPMYGTVGMISYPYFVLFEYITPILEILGILTVTLSFFFHMINLEFLIFFLIFYMVFNILASWISIIFCNYLFSDSLSLKGVIKLLAVSVFECIGYRQMCSLFRIGAFVGTRKGKHKWGNMERVSME
ncbi:glycosyltransferase family 2 protein [Paenibacillus gallinarum]|uniref:Glycosyltransferase family 2 protein n=1 Tax=Paenibacillus gallinarum TaxID=2762232 RepID=A0ABR8T2C5_9BACL|nr:glycosyltransferase [Paenibacillus gallinarum]MBD7969909.1 glycosyltransferase family 2 protein [Paenibacillus gallinarum]